MKLLIIVFLLIGSSLAIQPANNNGDRGNNYQFGAIGTAPLVNSGTVSANFRLAQIVTQDYTYTAPDPANAPNIAAIIITDLKPRKGATATITAGGVGQPSVTIRFTSQRGFGISSRVQIYAA